MTCSRLNMYKKRISKWQLQKNCKVAEKDAILQCIEIQRNLGVDLGQPMLNGKPVKMHVIHRYQKSKRKADCLASEEDHLGQGISSDSCHASEQKSLAIVASVKDPSANAKRARPPRQPSTILISSSRIADPTEYRNTQDLLVQLEHYIDAKLDGDPHASMNAWEKSSRLPGGAVRISYSFQDNDLACMFYRGSDLFERFFTAAECLNTGKVKSAWRLVNEGAAMVRACLQQECPEFLRRLLLIVTTKEMRTYPDISNQLLRQFWAIATAVLGKGHPITNVCRLLQSFPKAHEVGIVAMQKSLDAFEHRLGGDHRIYLNTLEKFCYALIGLGKYDEAQRAMRQLLKTCEQLRDRKDPESRRRLLELAGLYYDMGKNDAADDILILVTELGKSSGDLDRINVRGNELRGLICGIRGNYDAAELLLWTALSGRLLDQGVQDPFIPGMWINYQRVRRKQQQSKGAADAQDEDMGMVSVDSKEPVRCFSRPRSWSFPLEKPALTIATHNVEGRRSNRSRKRH